MEYRKLGRTGLEASVIGFGCNRIARPAAPAERREIEATLLEALDSGINLFDTANSYAGGGSETLLGRVLRGRRDRAILCSKVGARHWTSVALQRWTEPLRAARAPRPSTGRGPARGRRGQARPRMSFAPRFLELGVEGSLRRLGTDHPDVLFLHGPPAEVLADPAVFAKLDQLRERGWIRCYGVSFASATSTADILATLERWPAIAIVLVLVNPLASVDLGTLAPHAQRHGVAIVARQAFDKGALFGSPRLAPIHASFANRTPAHTLLRFPLQREGVDAVLVGMSSRAHLRDNLSALAAPPLSDAEMKHLAALTALR